MNEYAMNTSLVLGGTMYGGFVSGRALCADGAVRAVRFPRGGHADTFRLVDSCVPAWVRNH